MIEIRLEGVTRPPPISAFVSHPDVNSTKVHAKNGRYHWVPFAESDLTSAGWAPPRVERMEIVFALGSALAYGVSDFIGGVFPSTSSPAP